MARLNPNPMDYLLPGGHDMNDPDALARWIADNEQDQGGAVPGNTGFLGDQQEDTELSPEQLPSGQQQNAGQWGGFLSDPANRAFLINAGVQLMSGGWGGWGEQVGRALAAGFQGAHEAERAQLGPDPNSVARRGRGVGTRVAGGPSRRTAQLDPATTQRVQTQLANLQAAQELLANPALTEQEWNAQAQPGGLIHLALGPGAQFNRRQEYLVEVQQSAERLRQFPLRRRGGTVSAAELARLGMSDSPTNQIEFRILAADLLGSPGVGREHYYDRTTGRILTRRIDGTGDTGGRSEHARNARAAMEQGLIALDDVSEALANTTGLDRFTSNLTGLGVWSTVRPQINIISRALMHGLSGANVTLPETQAYLEAFMPNPNRPADWMIGRVEQRLNHARSLLVSILSAGSQMSEDVRFDIVNRMRVYQGLSALTEEQYLARMARYGIPTRPFGTPTVPPGGGAPAPVAPPVQPVAPPDRPPVVPPAAPKAEPSTPSTIPPIPIGVPDGSQWNERLRRWRAPDGTIYSATGIPTGER